jgi:hypothetical protein
MTTATATRRLKAGELRRTIKAGTVLTNFNRRLRRIMRAVRPPISIEELSAILGVTVPQAREILAGRLKYLLHQRVTDELAAICIVNDISTDYLFFGEGRMRVPA